ncbi:histidine phosphatase family protein [Sediminibacillus halophilus]|uniref:Broad specificity phosphatase PhoE n=1 Tax=Sediminibacillus halophilus TaxID=482461 RepID=A0A1G9NKG8_9BACI|nr:histidine phosphatase family protein [Sediminibacillus halophilus]SDL86841.1 Broad specificity phosphatase PhoE [Sediminibacillus halophilus]
MGQLLLIKHAKPIISSSIPSSNWVLSNAGIKQAAKLAPFLDKYDFSTIFTSEEPKAIHTARIIATELNQQVEIKKGLHEHERHQNRIIYPENEWQSIIKSFFDCPNDLVFGAETASEAFDRFDAAVKSLIHSQSRQEDMVIVAHGTVISLFVARYNLVNPYEIWQKLGMPAYVKLDLKTFQLQSVQNME